MKTKTDIERVRIFKFAQEMILLWHHFEAISDIIIKLHFTANFIFLEKWDVSAKDLFFFCVWSFYEVFMTVFFYGNEHLHIKHKNNSHLAPWLLSVPGIKEVITKCKD